MQAIRHGYGGAGEIRTLAPISRPTPLAGEPLKPLGYCSRIRRVRLVRFVLTDQV